MESTRPDFIPESWDLPATIHKRLGDAAGRQRVMDEEGHLLLILHRAPEPEDNEVRRPVLFWSRPGGDWRSAPEGGGLTALDAHLEATAPRSTPRTRRSRPPTPRASTSRS